MKKPKIKLPADEMLAWMLANRVVSASWGGVSLTLHPSVFGAAGKSAEEIAQPQGREVELPDDLHDPGALGLMFFSSHAGPPDGRDPRTGLPKLKEG